MFDRANSPTKTCQWSLPSWVGLGARAIPISEILLGGHTRMFHVPDERAKDDIAFVGMRQLTRVGPLAAQDTPEWLASHLILRCRYHYALKPLRGLRGSFRDSDSAAAALFSSTGSAAVGLRSAFALERVAWQQLFPERTARYDPRRFQHALAEHLSGLEGDRTSAAPPPFPMALQVMFRLPTYDSTVHMGAAQLTGRLGRHLRRLASGQLRGPMPKDPLRWVKDKLQHPNDPPLNASRKEALWAVALATHFGWTICYAAGMTLLARELAQPLTSEERRLFGWGHISKDLIGFPMR